MSGRARELVIAVDIGGGSVKLALADARGEELETGTIEDVPALDRAALLEAIGREAERLRDAGAAAGGLAGMAIGVPGYVSDDGRGSRNSNVPVLDGADLVGIFAGRFGCPVQIENDANLAALGEWAFGPHGTATRFMMVTLGTGIGVALLVDGRPAGVIGGTLGDAGHVVVDPAGARSCRLGCRGCLESVASGVALIEVAEDLADAAPDSALGALRRGAGITGADLARLAAAGDPPTLGLLAQTGRWLGMGLASYINTFAPDVICIGGGMSRFRPCLEVALLEGSAAGRIKNRPGPETIYFSAEYEQAAARGAVTLFLNTGEWGSA